MQAIHNPARLEGESFAAYKQRRAASNKIGREMRRDPNKGLVGARKRYRDSMRESGSMGKRTRAYVALMAAWAARRIPKATRRDENGSYSFVGRKYFPDGSQRRRMWLAGISAQRGF